MIRLERRPYCPILSNLLSGWRDLDRLQSTIRRPQSENSHSRLSNPFASTRAQQHPGLFWTAVGFERIFGATLFFGTDSMAGRAKMVQRTRFNFLQEAQIWYDRNLHQHPLSDQFENVIVLSDEFQGLGANSSGFYREITSHPIPTDLEAVKLLAGAPAALDLFMWLSYRCFVASGQESIPLFGERGLANQLGSIEYSRPRRFCQKLEQWLKMIRLLWPDCPAQINRTGDALLVSRGSAVRTAERIGA